jgi:hypothetical protein
VSTVGKPTGPTVKEEEEKKKTKKKKKKKKEEKKKNKNRRLWKWASVSIGARFGGVCETLLS